MLLEQLRLFLGVLSTMVFHKGEQYVIFLVVELFNDPQSEVSKRYRYFSLAFQACVILFPQGYVFISYAFSIFISFLQRLTHFLSLISHPLGSSSFLRSVSRVFLVFLQLPLVYCLHLGLFELFFNGILVIEAPFFSSDGYVVVEVQEMRLCIHLK